MDIQGRFALPDGPTCRCEIALIVISLQWACIPNSDLQLQNLWVASAALL